MIEEAVVARLKAVSGVTDIVGSRVYPFHLPQEVTLPAVSYVVTGVVPHHAMGVSDGPRSKLFVVSSWAASALVARQLAEAVRAALERFRGTVAGETIQDVFIEAETDFFESDTGTYHVTQTYDVIWTV